MKHVSEVLQNLLESLYSQRDNEISMAYDILCQYVTDHKDAESYKRINRQVKQLARAWDRMIAKLETWQAEASKIEASCENFYGD
jgi:hypothetical protein